MIKVYELDLKINKEDKIFCIFCSTFEDFTNYSVAWNL